MWTTHVVNLSLTSYLYWTVLITPHMSKAPQEKGHTLDLSQYRNLLTVAGSGLVNILSQLELSVASSAIVFYSHTWPSILSLLVPPFPGSGLILLIESNVLKLGTLNPTLQPRGTPRLSPQTTTFHHLHAFLWVTFMDLVIIATTLNIAFVCMCVLGLHVRRLNQIYYYYYYYRNIFEFIFAHDEVLFFSWQSVFAIFLAISARFTVWFPRYTSSKPLVV